MENGRFSAEEIRREKRRQKILTNSNDRIKKIITGYSEDPKDTPSILSEGMSKPVENILPTVENLFPDNTEEVEQESILYHHLHNEDDSDASNYPDSASALNNEQHQTENNLASKNETRLTSNNEFDSFVSIRTMIVLVSGILVRLSFLFSLGEQYVQTVFNPFMAMEIAIIGYQKAVNMDFGADVKGGIWLSTLVLAGIKPEIITSYKTVMGILSAIGMDFTLYLFSIIIMHIII